MAATNFPFTLSLASLTNATGNSPRFNIKNDGVYSIITVIGITGSNVTVQGYSSSVGDGGKATISQSVAGQGGISASSATITVADIIATSTTASSAADGFTSGLHNVVFLRCVAHGWRANGFNLADSSCVAIECEAYGNNLSNTTAAGFNLAGASAVYCISHDNTGSNSDGFAAASTQSVLLNCISSTNGRFGFGVGATNSYVILSQCDAYNNTSDGCKINDTTGTSVVNIQNCNFVKNGGWGINTAITSGILLGQIINCGFGSGTQVNTSGTTNNTSLITVSGSVIYASGVTPWTDPSNGNFKINLAAAKNAGRGSFTETSASLSNPNTVGYPDIGAAQHLDSTGQKSYTFGG
jgi:hypothetical protein